MKIVYLGRPSQRHTPEPKLAGDVIELLANNWDDYGNKTTFATTCRISGEIVKLGPLKLMIEGASTSQTYLDGLLKGNWDGVFPIPNTNYLSLPNEVAFYEQLRDRLSLDTARDAAVVMRDASYLIHLQQDPAALSLIDSQPFQDSLLRERGETKSYLDGWKLFSAEAMSVLDLGFEFKDVFGDTSTLSLKFKQISILPHNVNVLIGPNGVGKSQILHQMVEDWLNTTPEKQASKVGFVEKPNLSQVVVVSYSPFERFPVDLETQELQDKDIYRYFGFRGRSVSRKPGRLGGISLTHQAPKKNAAASLLDCLTDDIRYKGLRSWANKLETVERVLRTAFAFDYAAINVGEAVGPAKQFYSDSTPIDDLSFDLDDRRYLPISSDRINELNVDKVRSAFNAADGVTFFRDSKIVQLSSGQKLFSFIVINILGAIRRDSLILIDEPELFLHPTLEIQFIDMLKTILDRFNSKALLATHSLVTVREVPSECVHVLARTKDGLSIRTPPFQTFGGDMQRISSYVFGDSEASKPFERWIENKLEELGSAEALIAALGNDINEELAIQIQGMEREGW
ncbi:ATP-binding protein [Komagataeibacter sp. AV436]|uniref:ATP-binding protein n=1 Tax=Komagataeibacter melomenusus TaxID=2766578 RepID=A0ABX2AC40_9PROT|nr:ATP-binding protein [Komagataeibacter melomenusus]MBV1829158.1 ATP-binding protein [Komagataeibacter melomenusus]NPC65833.1 ATP-binding protein [Komagataeibacter melomenusus]